MKKRRMIAMLLLLGALLFTVSLAGARSTESFTVAWWTVDGGGGTSGDGRFSLHATTGQPDAGGAMGNGRFTLAGGFWYAPNVPVAPPGSYLYLPVVVRP
ncbi:MAG: hypothetical protein KC413_19955 [Anaerolineales bacterium]|nr:hypothetical protein [Anaerolineales bacterium]MCA9978050.1 hypothetical protein [Anaerolineales bacterium]